MWDTIFTIIYLMFILVFLPILIILYVVGGILDLTYFERHKKEYDNKCPYFIDKEE